MMLRRVTLAALSAITVFAASCGSAAHHEAGGLASAPAPRNRLPIIDMHLHASSLEEYGDAVAICTNDQKMIYPGVDPRQPITFDKVMTCDAPLRRPATDEAVMTESLAMLSELLFREQASHLR